MYNNICLMSVSDSKQSWKTCFDDMPGKTKLLPVPQKKEYRKMPQTISPSATLTHSELPIHFCRSYKFRAPPAVLIQLSWELRQPAWSYQGAAA